MKRTKPRNASGSVTVYLALMFCVFCSVIFAAIYSVKLTAGRAQAANSVDQAMYSLFAHYDQRLERKFGLFFINAGCSGHEPAVGACIREIEDAADCLLKPNGGLPLVFGANLLTLKRKNCYLTGYSLATDAGGAAFIREAEQTVTDTFGIQGISFIMDVMRGADDGMRRGEELRRESKDASYGSLKEESAQVREEMEEAARENGEALLEPEAPPGFVNPIPFLLDLQGKAVANLVLPEPVSDRRIDPKMLVSGRSLARGIGAIPVGGDEHSLPFKAYLLYNYSHFKAASPDSALAYELEYMLCGRRSDRENMEQIVKKLMRVREGANLAAIYLNTELSDEVMAVSEIISSLLLLPAAEPVIRLILSAGWAYAESIVDLRALLTGKRVAMMKSWEYWQTDLRSIMDFLGGIDALTVSDPQGLDYEKYLGILLLSYRDRGLAMRAMDMTEAEIRAMGAENFRLDQCIYSMDLVMEIRSEKKVDYQVGKSLSYGDL